MIARRPPSGADVAGDRPRPSRSPGRLAAPPSLGPVDECPAARRSWRQTGAVPRLVAPGIHAALGVAAAALIVTVTMTMAPAPAEAATTPSPVAPRLSPATSPAPIAALTVYVVSPTTYPPVTTAAPPTPTTLPSIRNRIPVPPSTVPLQTRTPSTHISPVFAALSGAGFFVALVMMATRFVMTRPRRRR